METVISNDDRIAMAEVDYIIHHMNERYLNKVPQKVRDYITILKKRNMKIYVDPHIPLEKQGLKEFTLYFLMILNLKYWCDDARRKDILLMLENNQKKYDEKINNIFDNANNIQGDGESELSNRPLNQPKKVVVAENSTVSNENIDVSEKLTNEKNNGLNDLVEEVNSITEIKKEGFFSRFINKIKSLLIRK